MGLAQILRRRFKVRRLLEAESFAEAIGHLKQRDVSLAIIDLWMPGLSGPKDLARMRLLHPEATIVVLSASDSRADILEALSAGVHGYIVKNLDTDQLISRLRYILSGEIYVPPSLAEQPLQPTAEAKRLSSRQRQVLKGLVEGKSNKQIARALNVAEGTVKS